MKGKAGGVRDKWGHRGAGSDKDRKKDDFSKLKGDNSR